MLERGSSCGGFGCSGRAGCEKKKHEDEILVTGRRLPSGACRGARATGRIRSRHCGGVRRQACNFTEGIAGVLTWRYAQPRFGQEIRLSICGSGISRGFHMRGLTLLQDGIPMNLADDNGDFQELDPSVLSHLEVYRGANAFRFGGTTLGGAINGVTPTGRARRLRPASRRRKLRHRSRPGGIRIRRAGRRCLWRRQL